MSSDAWLLEIYFDWLRSDAFSNVSERREYEGVLRVIHDVPFYWTVWSDSNRAGDALSFRQSDFLSSQGNLDGIDQTWLANWAMSTPSVLEVLLGMARRWQFYFEAPIQFYFQTMFANLGLNRYPGRALAGQSQEAVRIILDNWMSRQFAPNGDGSPFPVAQHSHVRQHALDVVDMRKVDLWGQMNAYSAEHFQ